MPGTLGFSVANIDVNENAATATITVNRTGGNDGIVTVNYATTDNTAIAGNDYTATSGTLTFADTETTQSLTVPILEDTTVEGNELFDLVLTNITGGATLGTATSSVNIVDNDVVTNPGTLGFSVANIDVNENAATATITVNRTGGTDGIVTVNYATNDNTAIAGTDYTTTSGTLTFADTETTQSLTVPILEDTTVEGNELFDLVLTNITGGATLGTATSSVNIVDNDVVTNPGTLGFSVANIDVNENATTATITVNRTGGTDGIVTVNYATNDNTAIAGNDYTTTSGTLTFADTETTQSLTVPILEDTTVEGNELFDLVLTNITGGATLGTATSSVNIVDNDVVTNPGTLGFSVANIDVNENATTATITVNRTGGTDGIVTVNYATNDNTAIAGNDYTTTSGTLTFADTETTQSLTVPILEDTTVEGNELFDLVLTNITGGATLGTATSSVNIVDNDVVTNPGTLGFSVANIDVNENATTATITVNRTGGTDGIVTVNYATNDNTAIAGNDYTTTSGTLTFADTETTQSLTVPILEDTTVEGNELFDLVLTNITGGATLGTATSSVNIVDNDVLMPGTINFSAATFSVNEDGTPITEITVTRTGGSQGAVSVNLTQTNGSATSPADYTNAPIIVNFADGDSTPKSVTIPIINDTTFEPTETLNLVLGTPTGGATLGTQNTASLQIVDNDPSSNLQLTSATYLGTASDDLASAVEISPIDQAIIVAGNFNGAGEIRRLTDANTAPLSTTALGGVVNDMDVDRDSGEIVTVGSFGIKVYNQNAGTVLWSQTGTFDRVAVANDGTVATLTNSNDTVTLWSPTGTQLATQTLTGTDIRPADITINPTTKQVYVTGFNQVTANLQTPFIRGFDTNLAQIWNTWDYSAAQVTGQNLGADTRGERITFGQNGGLYFLGKTDGGNNVFQRDGEDITQQLATKVTVDQYNNFAGAGSGSFTFHAKINPSDGSIERGQFILTNDGTKPYSFNPHSITADEVGNVYIGGSSAFQLQNRNSQQINGETVGNYTLGEIAVIGLTPDYTVRKFWTPLTQTGDTDGSKGNVNGFAVRNGQAAIFATINQPAVATTPGAINPNPLGVKDAYLALWNI